MRSRASRKTACAITCAGDRWHGPHTHDLPFEHIVDLMLQVKAQCYSFEAANVRHEHEWKLWNDVKLPDGKMILPGVVSHSTNLVEHPELVAERIMRFAERGRPRECHRRHRLRPWRPRARRDRLGQARRPGRGRAAGVEDAVEVAAFS